MILLGEYFTCSGIKFCSNVNKNTSAKKIVFQDFKMVCHYIKRDLLILENILSRKILFTKIKFKYKTKAPAAISAENVYKPISPCKTLSK